MAPRSPAASSSTPTPTASAQLTATRKRRVRFIKFTRPLILPIVGYVSQLVAEKEAEVDRPGSIGIGAKAPEMWWLVDQGVLQVGTRYFSISSPAVEHWDCD